MVLICVQISNSIFQEKQKQKQNLNSFSIEWIWLFLNTVWIEWNGIQFNLLSIQMRRQSIFCAIHCDDNFYFVCINNLMEIEILKKRNKIILTADIGMKREKKTN